MPEMNKQLIFGSKKDNSPGTYPKDINCLYTDASGNVWAATETQGLYLMNSNYDFFKTIPGLKEMMKSAKMEAIMEDNNKNWWIGSDSGLAIYEKEKKKLSLIAIHPSRRINTTCFLQEKEGGIWMGTYGDGVYYFPEPGHPQKFNNIRKVETGNGTISIDSIVTIAQDKYGNIWFGGFFTGLYVLNKSSNQFKHFDALDSFNKEQTPSFSQIANDQDGSLLLGTWTRGFYKISPGNGNNPVTGKFSNFTTVPDNGNSLSFPITTSLIVAKNGDIWVGTVSGGLNKFEPTQNKFTRYTIDEGMLSNLVYRIEEDLSGNIWFSSDEGIGLITKNGGPIVYFREKDGLPNRSFYFLASAKMSDGTIAFGTNDGDAVYFQPVAFEKNNTKPVITSFLLFNKLVEPGENNIFYNTVFEADTFYLKHNQSVFTFEFSNLDLVDPDTYTFAYKLDGIDRDWNYVNNRKSATYTNLSPGQYLFHLKSTNHSGIWSSGETIKWIVVFPPWYQTWWFYTLLVISIAAITYASLRFNINRKLQRQKAILEKQQAIEQERSRISTELHDDLGGGLSTIRILSEISQLQGETETGSLHKISAHSKDLLQKMNEIVWVLNTQNDTLDSLISYIRAQSAKMLDETQMHYVFDIPDDIPAININGINRRHIQLLVKEALHNIIKHAGATIVHFNISISQYLHIIISDNGIGIPHENVISSSGNGLANMRKHAALLKGEISIENNSGTTIKFSVSLKNLSHESVS